MFMALVLVLGGNLLPVAHAQVPDIPTWTSQVSSSTGQAAGYTNATIFAGGSLQFWIYMAVLGGLIALIFFGIGMVLRRRKI